MKNGMQLFSIWSGIIMLLLVFSGAVAFAFTDFMSDSLYGTKRSLFIGILVAYGIYRSFRLYQSLKHNSREN